MGVDPYTTNPVLKKELDRVAWAAFAGGLGVDVLASRVPGGRLVQSTSLVTDWIYEKPPGDLKVWIEKSLKDMGVDQATTDLFLRQKYWTMTTQSALVMALEKIGRMGLPVVAIPGNHDHAGTASIWERPRFRKEQQALAPNLVLVAGKAEGEAVLSVPPLSAVAPV